MWKPEDLIRFNKAFSVPLRSSQFVALDARVDDLLGWRVRFSHVEHGQARVLQPKGVRGQEAHGVKTKKRA